MALSDLINRVRGLLYGSGLGEKPALRIANANANETVSGSLVTFALATGEAAKVKPGNVLGVYSPAAAANAHVVYVTAVASSTGTVTGVNGYLGSPAVASDSLDGKVLTQNAPWTDHEIIQAIDSVTDSLLWPWVFTIADESVASPNLVHGQEAVAAGVEEIIAAWQVLSSEMVHVNFSRQPFDTDGGDRLAYFEWMDSSTGYYTYIEKLPGAATIGSNFYHLVALGAAALLLGGALVETSLEATKKDNAEAMTQRGSAGDRLWRDFLTLRANMSEELGRRRPQRIYIDRG